MPIIIAGSNDWLWVIGIVHTGLFFAHAPRMFGTWHMRYGRSVERGKDQNVSMLLEAEGYQSTPQCIETAGFHLGSGKTRSHFFSSCSGQESE